jgi:pilus assembly protein CpaE
VKSQPIRTLVGLDKDVAREVVQAALPVDSPVQIVGVVEGLEASWATLQETPTDLLVIACAGYSDRALFLIDGAVKQQPDRPVVVFSEGSTNGFVQRAFEAGADDFISLPESPEHVAFTLEKAMARKQSATAVTGVALAPMIVVLGPKGGTGKTITTSNLAVSLAKRGNKVVVVDLDLQFGDVGLALGLAPDKTIYDLVKSGGSMDADKIDAYLVAHSSGVRVLMAPTRPDHASVVTVEFLREVYATLRSTNDYVLVDTPPGFTPEVIASIDSSSAVCVVGTLDSLSLKNTKLGLETLELMGYSRDRIHIVLNRAGSRVGITDEDVTAILGRPPDVLVPSDRDIPRLVNQGIPIVLEKEKSEAAKALNTLSAIVANEDNKTRSRGRMRLRRKKA